MNLQLNRTNFTEKSTVGELCVDDKPFCFTLELPNKDGQHGSCISAGTYHVIITWSDRFQRAMPRLVNVPSREGILIHWGNYPQDTEGCILVGANHIPQLPDFIGNSRVTFNKLFPLLAAAPSITITINGGYSDLPSATTVP